MGRSRFWAAGLAVLVVLGSPQPVSAGGGVFVMSNMASDLGEPVPRGALLSLVTDAPVSADERTTYDPWVTTAHGGLYVEVGCIASLPQGTRRLPIISVQRSGAGHRVNVYWPNSMGSEPFGRCDNEGSSEVLVRPAVGFGPAMLQPVVTVQGHPGIFSVDMSGLHVNTALGQITPLSTCAATPTACPVRTAGQQAQLVLKLTGAEWFICDPCPAADAPITFAMAPVTNGVVGTYQPQTLLSLKTVSTGMEEARILLGTELNGGEYRLEVRNKVRPEMPPPLTLLLGPPN